MSYMPLNYEKINVMAGTYSPAPIKAFNNQYYGYWERALFQRAQSSIILDVPWDGSERDFLYYCLFRFGFVAVLKLPEYGLIFQPCTPKGFDIFYQPTAVQITNAYFDKMKYNKLYKLHEQAELIKLCPDYIGVYDIISHFAEKLAGMDSAINMSIINSKLAYILGARNKGAAAALKKIFDKMERGEPLVIYDQKILNDTIDKEQPFQFLERNSLQHSYLTSNQLQDIQTILHQFDAEVGIVTVPYEKKERMVTAEAESKANDALARVTVWNNTLNESMQKVNKLFGTTMKASIRNNQGELEKEGDPDE